ncbi:MAG: hypothetical protein ACKOKE_00180 [Actinomycetota bacterium]
MARSPRRQCARGTAVRRTAALVLACVASLGVAAVTADPAAAHGLGAPSPTDEVVTVDGLRPPVPGVTVRVVDLGARIELTNRRTSTITVLGYGGEPYLRIDRRGVWENRRSPATFLNRSATPEGTPPADLDADVPPEWERTSTSPTARWHDHRAHWMGRGAVRDEPWAIPLRVDGADARIVGTLDTRPAPSPLPWIGLAAGLALTLGLLAGTRRWPTALAVGLVVVIVSEAVHTAGAWGISSAGLGGRAFGAAPSLIAILLAVLALIRLLTHRDRPDAATPFVLLAGLFIAIAGGVADLGSLTHAVVPSDLDPSVTRLTIAVALGGGIGLAVGAARHLRPTVAAPGPVPVGG